MHDLEDVFAPGPSFYKMRMRDPEAGWGVESRRWDWAEQDVLGGPWIPEETWYEANAKSLLPLVADSGLGGHDWAIVRA